VNPRTTLILVVLAAALFGAVYWGEIRGADERREAEALEKLVFPDVEADAIEALAFDASDGQKVLLTRTDSGWRVAEPVDFPADDVAVDGLVSSLADLAIAVALFIGWRLRAMAMVQLAMVIGYTAILTVLAPALWGDPFGVLLKNLPIIALILVHRVLEEER